MTDTALASATDRTPQLFSPVVSVNKPDNACNRDAGQIRVVS